MEATNLFSIYSFDMFNPDVKAAPEKITLISGSNHIATDKQQQ